MKTTSTATMKKTEDKDDDIIIPSKGNKYLDPVQIQGIGTMSDSVGGNKPRDNTGAISDSQPINTSLGTSLAADQKKSNAQKSKEFFGDHMSSSGIIEPTKKRSARGDGPQTKLRPSKRKFSAFGQMNVKTALGGIPQIGPFGVPHNSTTNKFLKGLGFSGAFPLMNYREWGSGDKQFTGADFTEEEDES